MKQATNLPTKKCTFCTTKHRIIAWAVLIGIFVCGVMAGGVIWNTNANKMMNTAESGVYTEQKSPCQMREEALLVNINEANDRNWDADVIHEKNAKIYEQLVQVSCKENKVKYQQLMETESQIAEDLRRMNNKSKEDNWDNGYAVVEDLKPCQIIERNLLGQINHYAKEPNQYIGNARIYSKISEDGCSENSAMYAQKALDELQIAEGVRVNDKAINNSEMMTTVDTYKKLQMQNEARKYIKKVEKMVNPGIDFIMELQRIIEE